MFVVLEFSCVYSKGCIITDDSCEIIDDIPYKFRFDIDAEL
jgi:hypothetical protein